MRTMNRIIGVTAAIAIAVFIMYVYYGGCYKIKFTEAYAGGEKVVYQSVKGDYPKTEYATDNVIEFLQKNYKLQNLRCYSYYNANPHFYDKSYLKSEGGCIVSDSLQIDTNINKNFKIRILPKDKYILCQLPYKGKLSILISSIRFYPKLYNYLTAKGYNVLSPVTELFETNTKQITYRINIENKKS